MVIDPSGRGSSSPCRSTAGRTALREYTAAEEVRAELEVLDMDATRRLLTFFEPLLDDLGVVSRGPRTRRGNERLMVAGVKVSSQTPAIRSGQRIIFLLDDATGRWRSPCSKGVQPRCAKTVFHSFVLAVSGRTLRRTGVAGVSIVAEDVYDRSRAAPARKEGRLLEALEADRQGAVEPGAEEALAFQRWFGGMSDSHVLRPPRGPRREPIHHVDLDAFYASVEF